MEKTMQTAGTAGPGNMLACCLVYFHFLWAILWPHPVQLWKIRHGFLEMRIYLYFSHIPSRSCVQKYTFSEWGYLHPSHALWQSSHLSCTLPMCFSNLAFWANEYGHLPHLNFLSPLLWTASQCRCTPFFLDAANAHSSHWWFFNFIWTPCMCDFMWWGCLEV